MRYKGYTAKVEFEPESATWYGKISDIRDLITFESKSVTEIEKEFIDAVEEYLDFCKEVGKIPDVPARRQENFEFENSVQLAAI